MAIQGESAAQRRLSDGEANLEIRRWEHRKSEFGLYETHRKLESLRMELHLANQWADQAQREKINLCGELIMRNRLQYECQVRTSEEIEELRRICHEETNQVRKLKIEELSPRQERDPDTVSQLLAQIQGLQGQVNSLADAREFHDPDTASSSRAPHVPSQPVIVPTSRGMLSRDSGLPPTTRDTLGTAGNVFESVPAREGSSSAVFESSRDLATSSCGPRPESTDKTLVQDREVMREPQNSSEAVPCFQRGAGVFDHTCGTYSHGGMSDIRDFPSRKCILENSQTLLNFKAERSTSRRKIVQKQRILISQCSGSKKLREQSQLTN